MSARNLRLVSANTTDGCACMMSIGILRFRLAMGWINRGEFDAAAEALRRTNGPPARTRENSERTAWVASTVETKLRADHRELYGIYRDYIKHEDGLTHQRLGWNLAVQGFLFTAFAIIFSKAADLWKAVSDLTSHASQAPGAFLFAQDGATPASRYDFQSLAFAISSLNGADIALSVTGIGVAYVSWRGTRAAELAIKTLEDHWLFLHKEYKSPDGKRTHAPAPIGLPGIVGGGNPQTTEFGFKVTSRVQQTLMGVWAFIAILSLLQILVILLFTAPVAGKFHPVAACCSVLVHSEIRARSS